jgi:hypothetical protein
MHLARQRMLRNGYLSPRSAPRAREDRRSGLCSLLTITQGATFVLHCMAILSTICNIFFETSTVEWHREVISSSIHERVPKRVLKIMFQPSKGKSTAVEPQVIGPQTDDRIRLKLLVIAAESSDQNLLAIITLLDRIGIPYDLLIATEDALTQEKLWRENHAFYQGIILTTGNLLYWNKELAQWQSALDHEMWQLLWRFEARFGLRQLILYALGGSPEDYGLQLDELVSTVGVPLPLSLTGAGRQIFDYLNYDKPIMVSSAPVYLAEPSDEATLPLLVTQSGHTVAALHQCTNGRETLALTMAHGPSLLHTQLLGYGLVSWVTRGLFLGERRLYLNIHIDDIFNQNYLWEPNQKTDSNNIYRLTGDDANAVVKWLNWVQQERNSARVTLDFAFNGAGVMTPIDDDELATTLLRHQQRFRWLNHGYTHLLLDNATYAESRQEIMDNLAAATALQLRNFEPTNMVTADVSGLENSEFLRAASDCGIRCLVSDTSKAGWENPSPNTGIINLLQPDILCIPRRPTNLFYDVSTPDEWVSKYNSIYHSYWRRDLTVAEIVDQEAEMILRNLLNFDIDPIMFHQANLRAYDGVHSLLSHLIDKVLSKYNALYGDAPLVCLSMDDIGEAMLRRANYEEATVEATLTVGRGVTLAADRDVVASITGVSSEQGSTWYAGQWITPISLQAHTTHWVPHIKLSAYTPVCTYSV